LTRFRLKCSSDQRNDDRTWAERRGSWQDINVGVLKRYPDRIWRVV